MPAGGNPTARPHCLTAAGPGFFAFPDAKGAGVYRLSAGNVGGIMAPEAYRSPVYQQIADDIRNKIVSGELREGDPVPSLAGIKEAWGVHTETARRALDALRGDGLVSTRPGLPTVVAAQRTVEADSQVAGELGVSVGTEVRVTATSRGVLFSRR